MTNAQNTNWQYVGGDEFDGTELDHNEWLTFFPWYNRHIFADEPGKVSNYACIAIDDNVRLENGSLVLSVYYEPDVSFKIIDYLPPEAILSDGLPNYRSFDWMSGASSSKATYLYGLFEIRFRLPNQQGLFPAFWLNGAYNCYEEIDIFEFNTANNNHSFLTLHNDVDCDGDLNDDTGAGGDQKLGQLIGNGSGWHIISMEWRYDRLIARIDGVELDEQWRDYFSTLAPNYIPDEPKNLIVNLSVFNGTSSQPASFGGITPNPNTLNYPIEMEVDYVRVFKPQDYFNCTDNVTLCNYSFNQDKMTGKSIIIDNQIACNSSILNGTEIEFVAKDFIEIRPNFISNNSNSSYLIN